MRAPILEYFDKVTLDIDEMKKKPAGARPWL